MIPIKFKPVIDFTDGVHELKEELEQLPQFRPVVFGFSAEHAEYQEFGTGPHRGRSSYYMGKEGIEAIDYWVRIKLGITDPKERKKIVWGIVKKIEKEGIKPRPFFRPAIDSILNEAEVRINRGESFMDMADSINDMCNRLISAYGMDFRGDMRGSWFSWFLDEAPTISDDIRSTPDMEKISKEGWG